MRHISGVELERMCETKAEFLLSHEILSAMFFQ